MRLEVILCLCSTLLYLPSSRGLDEKSLLFEGEGDNAELKKLFTEIGKFKPTDIGDDEDNENGSGALGSGSSGSGEGSGVEPTLMPEITKEKTDKKSKETTPRIVDITLVPKETTISNCISCEEKTEEPKQTTGMNHNENERERNKDEDEIDVAATNDKVEQPATMKKGVNFTLGIIIGVVVGAVLAIMIIIFLVYRLRKKDEGSYSLDEQSSTAYLRGDTDSPKAGKEYFA